MRLRARIAFAAVLILSTLLVLQPLSATAADCSKEQQAFDELRRGVDKLNDELRGAFSDLGAAQRDMARAMELMNGVQQSLVGEQDRVRQQMESQGAWDAVKVLGPQVALSIALALAGPEVIGHTVHRVLDLLEKAHTAYETYELIRQAQEAQNILDELSSELGGLDAARAFADQHGLTELRYMIDQETYLAALMKNYREAWSRMEDAADKVVAIQGLLDAKAKLLQAAQEALYACLDKQTPEPVNRCSQPTNPGGAGICH